MHKYYFTFGDHPSYPYKDGYIIIWAYSYYDARDKFKSVYGLNDNGLLPFAFQYDYHDFAEAMTFCNMGKCHRIIK